MQVNNSNINTMLQLEKKLEESAAALTKLNQNSNDTDTNHQKNVAKQLQQEEDGIKEIDIAEEMVKQVEIPIAYSVNANVISVQNSIHQAVLDIKV